MKSKLMRTRRNGITIARSYRLLPNGMLAPDYGFFNVRRSTRGNRWREVGNLIFTFYGLKISIIAMLGIPAVEVKIIELEAGMYLERIGAFLFKLDPITVVIAEGVQWVIEAFSLVPMML